MTRQVRVTLEGAVSSGSGSVMRLRVGAQSPAPAFPLLVVDTSWPGVSVEDVTPERQWTDGDVIVDDGPGGSGWVWTRLDGEWTTPSSDCLATDAAVSADMVHGYTTVLRYQAGDR